MQNPIYKIFSQKKPFIYFHTHVINREVLDAAVAAHKSLEIDISINKDGTPFIGHPLSFYESKKLPPPNNLPLNEVLEAIKMNDIYLVLDVKDVRALPLAQEIIQSFGLNRTLLHAFTDALLFTPYPKEIIPGSHWPYENIPLAKLLEIKQVTNIPLILSSRGLTPDRLRQEPKTIDKIIAAALDQSEAVNFNLPNDKTPSQKIMDRLLENKILTLINIDCVPETARPTIYLGRSDAISAASDPRGF